MTQEHMDWIANEVIIELGLLLEVSAIDLDQSKPHLWSLKLSAGDNRFFEAVVDLSVQDNDEKVKADIRRQIEAFSMSV